MDKPGDQLTDLCRGAENQLVLVAPFVKVGTLERLLNSVANDVTVKCVTRWRLDEIASGVSDLEVWPVLRDRPNSSLWLRSDLHAKFYRADSSCLIGSANLTNAALGWSKHANFELLMASIAEQPILWEFEQNLFAGSIRVDDALYKHMCVALEQFILVHRFPTTQPSDETETADEHQESQVSVLTWLPTLRHPEKLYVAYLGKYHDLTITSRKVALGDLSTLDIPKGLSKEAFEFLCRSATTPDANRKTSR